MNLIRFAGRSLLGGYFVVNGAKTIVNPRPLLAGAQPVATKLVPLAKQAAPEQIKDFIPEDTTTLVRVDGALQVLGGLGLITGIGRRAGATMISTAMIPAVLASRPGLPGTAEDKQARSQRFLHDLGLLGAALVVSQDTQGKPNLAWRAEQQRRHLAKSADKQANKLGKGVEKQKKELARSVEHAQKQAAKQAKQARKQVSDVLPG